MLTTAAPPPVQAHQNNLLRIQQLRQSSTALDAQVRDTLASLAATRRGIVTTHTTVFPREPNYPVAYEEPLSSARRISKNTLPPAATIAAAAAAAAAAATTAAEGPSPSPLEPHTPRAAAAAAAAAADSQPLSAVTPSAPTPSQTQSPAANGPPSMLPPGIDLAAHQAVAANLNTGLPEGMGSYLNPLSGQPFFPWPLEDKIRSGSLASCQMLLEQGIDPKGYDPATEDERRRKEDEDRRAREDQEKKEREERERQMGEERERLRVERERQREREQQEWRRASIAGNPPDASGISRTNSGAGTGAGEKKQFQFTSLDDLDDDDDDED